MLYQSQEAEKFMDTIIFGPAQAETTCAHQSNVTIPCPPAPLPVIVPDESWVQLRARPKTSVSAAPSHPEPWLALIAREGGASHHIQMQNRFDIFSLNFPPLDGASQAPSPSHLPLSGCCSSF